MNGFGLPQSQIAIPPRQEMRILYVRILGRHQAPPSRALTNGMGSAQTGEQPVHKLEEAVGGLCRQV